MGKTDDHDDDEWETTTTEGRRTRPLRIMTMTTTMTNDHDERWFIILKIMIDQLIVFQKLYDLYLYTHKTVAKFPKSQRFMLSNHLLQTNMEMIKLAIIANSKRDRLEEQKQISVNLDLFRIYIRICREVNFLSIKKYGIMMERINEVGRLLTGWRKIMVGKPDPYGRAG